LCAGQVPDQAQLPGPAGQVLGATGEQFEDSSCRAQTSGSLPPLQGMIVVYTVVT